jgi:hypothetical protein
MRFNVEFDPYQYRIFKITDLKDCLLDILLVILTKERGFMSINVSHEERSIIMRTDLCTNIVSIATNSTIYKLIKVDACTSINGGIDQYGVLSELTKKFAQSKIPILVVSSFNDNYILYPIELHSNVLKLCKSSDFDVISLDDN